MPFCQFTLLLNVADDTGRQCRQTEEGLDQNERLARAVHVASLVLYRIEATMPQYGIAKGETQTAKDPLAEGGTEFHRIPADCVC